MTDDDVVKLRDALYSVSETICTEIQNTDREAIWHESLMAHATAADIEALLREDAQYAEFLATNEVDDGPLGFDSDRHGKPN